MKVRIEIDTQTFVRFWLVVIGFALAGVLLWNARTALIILGVAFFLALALNGPVARLARLLPGKSRVGGTALAFTAVVATLGLFVVLVVPPIIEQSVKFAETIPQLVNNAQERSSGLSALVDRYNLEPQIDNAVQSMQDNVSSWATSIGKNVLSGLSSLASFLAAVLLVLVLTFLMLVEGPEWVKRLWGVYRDQERMEYHRRLAEKMYGVVTSYITGQLTVSSIGALAAGLVVFVLSFFTDVPANMAMPIIALTFILSLVPMFGATIAGVLATVLLGLNDLTAAIIYVIYFVIYQQVENNFISPAIQSRSIDLSALVVLAAATVGLYMFGIAGGIIAIPIAGCLKVLLQDYLERAHVSRKKSNRPVAKLLKKAKESA